MIFWKKKKEKEESINDSNEEVEEEGVAFNFALNIIIPALILVFLSKENRLGPLYGLIVALSIPFTYGVYHFIKNKNFHILSLLGIVSISITGGVGLFHLDRMIFAIKEALVPFVIGSIFLYLTMFNFEKMKPIFFNKKVFQTKLIESKFPEKKDKKKLNALIKDILMLMCFAFYVGALMNFILAKTIVLSDPGTVAFNEELGHFSLVVMLSVSLPLFLLLMSIVYFFVRKLNSMTDLTFDQIFGLDDDQKK